ncbi:MAG: hypothetical protein BWX86_00541 [Verrucomicrobia bacterium ADurb.Bin122]|nr:MAG: hypothetical protein BWX86_00541 [Verrucomicrobia bacterium ADurb.Bin122]
MVFDAETAKAVQAFVTLEQRQEALRQKSEALKSSGGGGDSVRRSFDGAGRSVMQLAGTLGVATTAAGIMAQTVGMIRRDWEASANLVRGTRDSMMELAATPGAGGPEQRADLRRQAVEYGITDLPALYGARAALQQSSQGLPPEFVEGMWKQSLQATNVGMPLQGDVLGGIMRLGRVAEGQGMRPEQVFGMLDYITDNTRVGMTDVARYAPGAISTAVEGGATVQQGAALLTLATQGPVKSMRESIGEVERFVKALGDMPRQITEEGRITPRGAILSELGVTREMQFPQVYERMGEAYRSGTMTPDMQRELFGDTGPMTAHMLRGQGRYQEIAQGVTAAAAPGRDAIAEEIAGIRARDPVAAAELDRRAAVARENEIRAQSEGAIQSRDTAEAQGRAAIAGRNTSRLMRALQTGVVSAVAGTVGLVSDEAATNVWETQRTQPRRSIARDLARMGRWMYGEGDSAPTPAIRPTAAPEPPGTASGASAALDPAVVAAAVQAGVEAALRARPLDVQVTNPVNVNQPTPVTLPRSPGGE